LEQIGAWSLPTAPPKATDRRAFAGETLQAEAIPPDQLAAIVREAIEARQGAKTRQGRDCDGSRRAAPPPRRDREARMSTAPPLDEHHPRARARRAGTGPATAR
jgi:hypothetical protein